MRLAGLLPSLLLLAATTTAWPALWNPLDAAKGELAPLLDPRADKTSTTQASSSAPATKTTKTTTAKNGDSNASSSSGSSAAASTGKSTITKTTSNKNTTSTTSKYETTKTFSDVLPPGGVSMITPAAVLGAQYYKIGNSNVTEFVTFAWNYTSLSITPSAVDVLASCSLNSVTYTIALNQSIAGPIQTVLWDTGEYERTASIPLAVATYTLLIYDSQSSPDAIARAGYLGTYDSFTFGMYNVKAPVAMDAIVCATCGAASSLDRRTVGFLVGWALVTVLSFGWFTGVAGLW